MLCLRFRHSARESFIEISFQTEEFRRHLWEVEMKDPGVFFEAFRTFDTGAGREDLKPEEWHKVPVSEVLGVQQGFLIMISKIIEMARLLSVCILDPSRVRMDQCADYAIQVHKHRKILTADLLSSGWNGELVKDVMPLPFQLEGVAEDFEIVLACCRLKTGEKIMFGSKAQGRLHQSFAVLQDMLTNLLDAFTCYDDLLVQSIITESTDLARLVDDFRSMYRFRDGKSPDQAKATDAYQDILDAVKSANHSVAKICATLLELGASCPISTEVREDTFKDSVR